MSLPEQEFIIDPSSEKGPQDMDTLIDRHMAIRIGRLTAVGWVIRAADETEVAAHAARNPEAHQRLRDSVIENLAQDIAIPEAYTRPQLIRDTDAA